MKGNHHAPHTEEVKRKLSVANPNRREVKVIKLTSGEVTIYSGVGVAAREYGINTSAMVNRCKKNYIVDGMLFGYNDEDVKNYVDKRYGERTNPSKSRRQVEQYDLSGNYLATYESMIDVQKSLGIATGNISDCCSNKRKSAGGFVWRYADE